MPLLDLFWSMLVLFIWIAWIWLVVSIFVDIFRSDDLGGWSKALWSIFVLLVPFLGVFIYLIVRGGSMQQRAADDARAQNEANQAYIREVAGSGDGVADEITKLDALRQQGAITDQEFAAQKAKLLA